MDCMLEDGLPASPSSGFLSLAPSTPSSPSTPPTPEPADAWAARTTGRQRSGGKKRPAIVRVLSRMFRVGDKRHKAAGGLVGPREPSVGPAEATAAPRLRWAVRTADWAPSAGEFAALLALLPAEQRQSVTCLRYEEDRKRALAARLLARAAAAAALGLSPDDVHVLRTLKGKPYVDGVNKPWTAPNWNFSISHEGDYVILASEPLAVCGCDVAAATRQAPSRGAAEPLHTFFAAFHDQFTHHEWQAVYSAGSEAKQEAAFRRLWSLKEAFVKATGEGLSFDLGLLEFEVSGPTASVRVRGEPLDGWAFHLHELDKGHYVSVARAPPSAVVDAWTPKGGHSFTSTFGKTEFSPLEWFSVLTAPEPAFTRLSIVDLLSPDERAAVRAAR